MRAEPTRQFGEQRDEALVGVVVLEKGAPFPAASGDMIPSASPPYANATNARKGIASREWAAMRQSRE